jgi:hypothetical protein
MRQKKNVKKHALALYSIMKMIYLSCERKECLYKPPNNPGGTMSLSLRGCFVADKNSMAMPKGDPAQYERNTKDDGRSTFYDPLQRPGVGGLKRDPYASKWLKKQDDEWNNL